MKKMAERLLIVEDDPGMTRQLSWSLDRYDPVFATDRAGTIEMVRRHEPQVVLLDLGLPPMANGTKEGMCTLSEILQLAPATKVIVVTGNGDEDSAIKAIAGGAYDFYQKPIEIQAVELIIQRAFYIWNLEFQNRQLRAAANRPLEGLVAASESMRRIVRQIEKVAPTSATTLLQGETGTGKEVLARALHQLSSRADQSFVAINCASIPEHLLESELFGYEKGAFTGAQKQTIGKVELAEGGTLFLDEIGDMAPGLQAKLLRFLQERVIERVGGRREIPVDTRVICATHQDLEALIKKGEFRQDLYYRIAEITIAIPPLREREGDAIAIAKVILEKSARSHNRSLRGFTSGALEAIECHDWPGNVRELEHRISSAVILAEGKTIDSTDLGLESLDGSLQHEPINLRHIRDAAERRALERGLMRANGNISEAARLLGVSRPAIYDLMRKHVIEMTH